MAQAEVDDIPVEVKRQIIDQEITLWRNTAYQTELRHRVNKRIGADEQVLAGLLKELERCERMIDALSDERKALVS